MKVLRRGPLLIRHALELITNASKREFTCQDLILDAHVSELSSFRNQRVGLEDDCLANIAYPVGILASRLTSSSSLALNVVWLRHEQGLAS